MPTQTAHPPVAIIGASALFPESAGATPFWQNILDGKDLITDVPPTHWLTEDYYDSEPGDADKTYANRGGFLPDIEFDPVEYGIPPNVIPATDTTQLMALMAAKKVLEDAFSTQFRDVDKSRMSVILGVTAGQELLIQAAARLQRPQWQAALREHGLAEDDVQAICDRIADKYTPWQESTFPGLLGNVVAGRIANRFDLGGTNCITDAACASSLSALSMALDELYLGHSDVVLTGGVDCFNDIFMYMCFTKTPALSKTGDCRPFSDGADGTLLGEGLGMFALKRLADAEADGDQIYAVIRGLGSSSDGRSLSVYAPLPEGQAKALRRAQERAGVAPETIELVEAHGTATKAGDVAEFQGLCHAFSPDDGEIDRPWCALGSIKSQIGHTKAAAGAASLFKAVMALRHGVLPPTIKVDRPSTKLDVDESPFYINTEARPWIRGSDHPRRAGISSFGFGGSNFHVVVEEYTGSGKRPARKRVLPAELFAWSASSEEALVDTLSAVIDDLGDLSAHPGDRRKLLSYMAHHSQQGFDAGDAHRLSFAADDLDELRTNLERAIDRIEDGEFDLPGGVVYRNQTRSSGEVGLLFPGQGSQYVSMGAELAIHFEAARRVWDEAADLDFDVSSRVFPPPAFDDETRKAQRRALTATQWAQPAIGADSAAKWALLERLGVQPAAVAGHSYGEITALFAAGAFDQETMLEVARRRGELMAEASESTDGAMTAVRADADTVAEILDGDDVAVANDNGPHQVVISGPTEAVKAAEERLSAEGLAITRLPVDTAFHSSVVADATGPFEEFLNSVDIADPKTAVYANTTAAPYDAGADAIRATLTSQIESPVRFADMVARMQADGVDTFIEVGPGDVLTGLTTRCLTSTDAHTVAIDRRGASDVRTFFSALATLSALGVELDFSALWEGYASPEDPRTREPSKFSVTINGANVDRPYPPPEGPEAVPAPNPTSTLNGSSPQGSATLNGKAPDHGAFMSDSNSYSNGRAPQTNGAAPSAHSATPRAAEQTPAAQPSVPSSPESARAFTEYQRSLAESHQAYLRMMEESVSKAQMAYMQAMEASFRQWCGGDGDHSRPNAPSDRSQTTLAATSPPTGRVSAGRANGIGGLNSGGNTSKPFPVRGGVPASAGRAGGAVQPQVDGGVEQPPISKIFLDVTAQKTGYPADMLDDSMALEADLGIDSIKRVEILSAVQEQVPSLPELDPGEMASLKTVGEIVDYLEGTGDHGLPDAPSDRSQTTLAATSPPTGRVSVGRANALGGLNGGGNTSKPFPVGGEVARHSAPSAECRVDGGVQQPPIAQTFLQITAQKTGYPADMLDDSMALEADLGIDSIKRVEILSAVQEKVPSLPELDPNEMASLKTVGEIVDYLESFPAGGQATEQSPPTGGDRLGKRKAARPARFEPGLAAAKPAGINGLTPSEVTIVDDGTGVGAALSRELASRGYLTSLVDDVDGDNPPSQLIDLRGLQNVETIDEALQIQRGAFQAARTICDDSETFVVVFDTGGHFGFGDADPGQRAWLGGLSALAKTAALEWPDAEVQAIDIATDGVEPAITAARIADELTAGGPEKEVAIDAEGRRSTVVARKHPYPEPEGAPQITDEDVVVASGGARGVTARCLIELARETGCAIALLGRTPLEEEPTYCKGATTDAELKRAIIDDARSRGEIPNPADVGKNAKAILKQREVRATLHAIKDAGSPVRYITADVRDREALARAFDEIHEVFGPTTTIVHAAGVLADRRIKDKTDDQFDFVFDTKVDGLRALLETALPATEGPPSEPLPATGGGGPCEASSAEQGSEGAFSKLPTLSIFSSVAARTGNTGQVDYAMANETLNKVAAQLSHEGMRTTSLQWGPWDGGMVDETLRKHFAARGVSLIGLQEGARAFCDEMIAGHCVEVVLGDGLPEATGGIKTRISFDSIAYPELTGHTIGDTVVVPMALVAELFTGLASALRPDNNGLTLSELQMLQGIQLPDFQDLSTNAGFIATATPTSDDRATLELKDVEGTTYYRATAHFQADTPAPLTVPETLEDSRWDVGTLYSEHLFHDGPFRVIEDTRGIGTDTARATIAATSPHVALDAALQLALVQGTAAAGRPNLPTRIEQYADFGLANAEGELELLCVTRKVTAHKTETDLDVLDTQGDVVASLRGLEMYFH